MLFIFVINGRPNYLNRVRTDIERQLAENPVEHMIYVTKGQGDAIRFVRLYCDLHEKDEVCFVACGGSGTLNEVASGIVGFKHKSLAFLAFGATNDFCKSFPGLDFTSFRKILDGTRRKIDIIRAGDNYAINVANAGFDAMATKEGNTFIAAGMDGAKAYRKGVMSSLIGSRMNRIQVIADGKKLNGKWMLLVTFGNGQWYGGQFHCSPNALTDDGLMDICLFKCMTLLEFFIILRKYTIGKHLTDPFCQKRLVYCKASRAELKSDNLIYLALDGEVVAASRFDIEVIPSEIDFIFPGE